MSLPRDTLTCQLTGAVKPQPASRLSAPICNRAVYAAFRIPPIQSPLAGDQRAVAPRRVDGSLARVRGVMESFDQ